MNTAQAFIFGAFNRGREGMVFDWNKAAMRILEEDAREASAGLRGDWEWTGGTIFEDGKPVTDDVYVYLASTWAVPELEIDGFIEDCYIMASEVPAEWGEDLAEILWPESALAILNGKIIESTGNVTVAPSRRISDAMDVLIVATFS